VAKKELNLLQFGAGSPAEPSTALTKIVRCEFGNANFGGELLDDVPDQLCRSSFAPSSTGATLTPEELSHVNSGSLCPFVQQAMYPIRDGNGSNVISLSAQVHDCPMPFALLPVAESQLGKFMPTESTGQQEGKERPITFALQPLAVRCLPECLPLCGQPVAQPGAQLRDAFDVVFRQPNPRWEAAF
jgi:hypothetical protein